MGKTIKRFAIGTVVAAAAGYVAGILTAPKSGKETRADIRQAAERTRSQAERDLKKLHTELTTLMNQAQRDAETFKGKAREELDQTLKAGMGIREKAREVLTALHEGTADDKDLKKAIDDATKAVDHLKAYVKKKTA